MCLGRSRSRRIYLQLCISRRSRSPHNDCSASSGSKFGRCRPLASRRLARSVRSLDFHQDSSSSSRSRRAGEKILFEQDQIEVTFVSCCGVYPYSSHMFRKLVNFLESLEPEFLFVKYSYCTNSSAIIKKCRRSYLKRLEIGELLEKKLLPSLRHLQKRWQTV